MSDGRSIDIIRNVPAKPKIIDWDVLFQEFVLQEQTTSPNQFLRDMKGWPQSKVTNGNTQDHIVGWGRDRAVERQKLTDARMDEARAMFADLMPQIQAAKREIIQFYLETLQKGNKRVAYNKYGDLIKEWYEPLNVRDRSHILTKLKTELGEPAMITKTNVDDVGAHRDPALAVMMLMGIFVDGQQRATTVPGYEPEPDAGSATPADVPAPENVA